MKDKLTPGMNKAEREALELRNTVRLLEAEMERLRLAGETAAPNLDQSANIAQILSLIHICAFPTVIGCFRPRWSSSAR